MRSSMQGGRALGALLLTLLAGSAGPSAADAHARHGACEQRHWVGAWAASPSDGLGGISGGLAEEAVPGGGLADAAELAGGTFRLVLTPHLGGRSLRVRLSNRFGRSAVTFQQAAVGLRAEGANLRAGSARQLTFSGRPSVTVPAGGEVLSDATQLTFRAFDDLAVSLFVIGPIDGITEHFTARQTSYFAALAAGDRSMDTSGLLFATSTTTRPFVSGVDVRAAPTTGALVALGDSITDGYGGTPSGTLQNPTGATENPDGVDGNASWPDELARRLRAAGRPLSVLNAAISGNRILQDGAFGTAPIFAVFGPAALTRLDADALHQSGAVEVLVLEGINDLGQSPPATAAEVIAGLTQIVQRVHGARLPVQLGTLLPSAGYGDDGARRQINAWIRTQSLSDGVIDFDRAMEDPTAPNHMRPEHDSSDHLHPSPAGYRAMAQAVDLASLPQPCSGPHGSRRATRR